MNTRPWRVLAAFLWIGLQPLTGWADLLSKNQARFGPLKGTVFVLTQGAPGWIDAHEGLPLEPGDQIHTEEEGEAEILLGENVFAYMRPDTDVTLDFIAADKGAVHLLKGTLFGRVDHERVTAPQDWQFQTPAAVVGIRGTEFVLDVSESKETHVGVLDGHVQLTPAEGPEGPVPPTEIGPRQEAVFKRGRRMEILKKFSPAMEQHAAWRAAVRAKHQRLQRVWTPFTPAVRQELRKKFVAPVAIRRTPKRVIPRRPAHKAKPQNRRRNFSNEP